MLLHFFRLPTLKLYPNWLAKNYITLPYLRNVRNFQNNVIPEIFNKWGIEKK